MRAIKESFAREPQATNVLLLRSVAPIGGKRRKEPRSTARALVRAIQHYAELKSSAVKVEYVEC